MKKTTICRVLASIPFIILLYFSSAGARERLQRRREPASSATVSSPHRADQDLGGYAKISRSIHLPSGDNLIFPLPGNPQRVNSFPAALAVSPDGRYAVTLDQGYGTAETDGRQSLDVMNLQTGAITDFPESRLPLSARQSYFFGLQFSLDGRRLYASFGSLTDPEGVQAPDTGNGIGVYSFDSGRIAPIAFWKAPLAHLPSGRIAARLSDALPSGRLIPYPAGLAVYANHGKERLLVADNLSDDAVVLNAETGKILHRFNLSTQKVIPGSYPYGVAVTADGSRAWVSLWNASRVAELDLTKGRLVRMISLRQPDVPTDSGSHPTSLVLSPEGKLLYVALANTDEVAEIRAVTGRVLAYYSTALPGDAYRGAQPIALALDAARNRLYVADAGVDAVAVLDVSHSLKAASASQTGEDFRPLGFIPAEWYPSVVAVADNDLLIVSAKGEGTRPNEKPSPLSRHGFSNSKFTYILELLHGSVARISLSSIDEHLSAWTRDVALSDGLANPGKGMPFPGGKNPIHHVIYIIRENRTYDQVLGDLKGANGDPSLAMYGEGITPNAHALARSFGILDNFYASGEVSGDGHNWSTAAIASDYDEATLPINYRNSPQRLYDFDGEVANRLPLDDDMPDVNEAGTGYIWTDVARHGLTYRHYGEFVATEWCGKLHGTASPRIGMPARSKGNCAVPAIRRGQPLPSYLGDPHGSPSPWPWPVPMIARDFPTKPELRGHFDPRAADFNLSYPDQLRVDEFLNEFSGFVRARETRKGIALPDYILLRLPDDHTAGTRPGMPTPSASIADNDLALGRVVEAVSHSPYWDDTAILVVEDDAQNGPDHVDAHRTVALVVSKYSPSRTEKPYVDSTFYTTVSLVRTLEVLLGLPPMNTNDAHAPVIARLFSGDGNHPPFTADVRNLKNGLIYRINSPQAYGAAASMRMDFSVADRAPAAELNEILWHDRMGARPMPASR